MNDPPSSISDSLLFIFSIIAKIEDENLPIPQVDTIVSEPIGVLLFHERMVIVDRLKKKENALLMIDVGDFFFLRS